MGVTIMVGLFGKPGQELDEGGPVTPDQLRALGQCLHVRLDEAADIIEQLNGTGWDSTMSLYDVMLSHPYIRTESEVLDKLHDLDIEPEKVCIMEDDEDEEDFDEPEFE
jgi:hypothetical protein